RTVRVDPEVDGLVRAHRARGIDLEAAEPQLRATDHGRATVSRAADVGLERQVAELGEVASPAHVRPGRIDAALDRQLIERALRARLYLQRAVERDPGWQWQVEGRRDGRQRRALQSRDLELEVHRQRAELRQVAHGTDAARQPERRSLRA